MKILLCLFQCRARRPVVQGVSYSRGSSIIRAARDWASRRRRDARRWSDGVKDVSVS